MIKRILIFASWLVKTVYNTNGRKIKTDINISKYNIDFDIGAKIVLISDLHERNPDNAIETIKRIQPDYILFPGDLWERNALDSKKCLNYNEMNYIQSRRGSFMHHKVLDFMRFHMMMIKYVLNFPKM